MAKKNPYKDTPEVPSDMQEFVGSGYTVTYDNNIEWADISINGNHGFIIYTKEKFFMRLWLMVSNPFRYLFTGKMRY